MNQDERLTGLLETFREESGDYQDLPMPSGTEERRALLRSLMNVRMPRELPEETQRMQDEYLQERAEEKGVVTLEDIPTQAGRPHGSKLSIWQGDITRLRVGAVVNAANSQMLGCFVPMHTCIDNCIHTFAGVQLRTACDRYMKKRKKQYGPCYEEPTGEAVLTPAYNLPADYVIHTVGPIVEGRLRERHRQDLKKCYRSILECCLTNDIRSVAFCCISTGVFHFPNEEAAEIAVNTVMECLDAHEADFDRIIFNVFKDFDRDIYQGLLL
jgi:O-acetyl-ADP-ribose deacetylase (regulator of RNase III)